MSFLAFLLGFGDGSKGLGILSWGHAISYTIRASLYHSLFAPSKEADSRVKQSFPKKSSDWP